LSNKNNISQFDNLFKEGLSGHSVPTPSGAFQGISQGLSIGSVAGSAAVGIKLLVGSIVAVTIATTAYFAINTDAKKNDAQIAVEQTNNVISNIATNKENAVTVLEQPQPTEKIQNKVNVVIDGTAKSASVKNNALLNTFSLNEVTTEDKKIIEITPKTAVLEAETSKSIIYPIFSIINIAGNACPYSKAIFNVYPANNAVAWFINDEKVATNTSNCAYVFNQKGYYKIECYSNKTKIADTFIEIGMAKASINYIDMGEGLTEAKADVSGIKSLVWMINGQLVSEVNGFVYNANHYKNEPYLITTDYRGCKDTFYKNSAKTNSSAYFILGKENTITPNGDGLNDEYEFEIAGQTFFSMAVYDKNEQIIYNTTNPKAYWNGIDFRTQKVAENGVYNIVFTYKLVGENENNFKYVRINLLK